MSSDTHTKMANVTEPLIKSVQGSDPQNLMEYITRQKIYDSRFWKEECFGLTAADVTERAAQCAHWVGREAVLYAKHRAASLK